MSMPLFLTAADIQDLTGYQRAHDQIRWLRQRTFVFELGADGKPRILRSYVERRMGGAVESPPAPKREPRLRLSSAQLPRP